MPHPKRKLKVAKAKVEGDELRFDWRPTPTSLRPLLLRLRGKTPTDDELKAMIRHAQRLDNIVMRLRGVVTALVEATGCTREQAVDLLATARGTRSSPCTRERRSRRRRSRGTRCATRSAPSSRGRACR